jgi:hypothetical protein
MKFIVILLLTFTSPFVWAVSLECRTSDHIILIKDSGVDILISVNGESASAEGLISANEVDLVAKLRTYGEMTLFAKIGNAGAQNHAFITGKRFSVSCR